MARQEVVSDWIEEMLVLAKVGLCLMMQLRVVRLKVQVASIRRGNPLMVAQHLVQIEVCL